MRDNTRRIIINPTKGKKVTFLIHENVDEEITNSCLSAYRTLCEGIEKAVRKTVKTHRLMNFPNSPDAVSFSINIVAKAKDVRSDS